VLVLEGDDPKDKDQVLSTEALRILTVLLRELTVKSASQMTAEITGERRETLYREALRLTSKS
ncbi:MAG: hypothetical protein RL333_1093, partial [Pseudomonadota bacterium]